MKSYLYKVKWIILIKITCAVVSIAFLAGIPFLNKALFDLDFKIWGNYGLIILIGMYFFAYLMNSVFEYFNQWYSWKLDWKLHLLLRDDLFKGICRVNRRGFHEKTIGEYISLFQNDVEVTTQYVFSYVSIIQTAIQLVVYICYLLILDWRVMLVILAGTFFSMLAPKVTGKELSHRKREWIGRQGIYLDLLKDLFSGFNEINKKTRDSISEHHYTELKATEDRMLYYGKFSTFVHVLNGAFLYFINIVCFATVGVLFFNGSISMGIGVAALGYVNSFIDPLCYILEEISNVKSSKGIMQGLMDYLKKLENADSETEKNIDFAEVKEISITGLYKKYSLFELKNVNLYFHTGVHYGIIGHNGAGKSTLFRILSGQETIDSGKIIIDGIPSENYSLEDIVAYAGPESHVFKGTFWENITLFGAYEENNLYQWIRHSENKKLENLLKKKQAESFSSGEKQAVIFFRTLTGDPPVMLFDEPFSAMDVENRKNMHNIVRKIDDKIIITITHDLTVDNLTDFDILILMRKGKIAVIGKPEDVMKTAAFHELTKR